MMVVLLIEKSYHCLIHFHWFLICLFTILSLNWIELSKNISLWQDMIQNYQKVQEKINLLQIFLKVINYLKLDLLIMMDYLLRENLLEKEVMMEG